MRTLRKVPGLARLPEGLPGELNPPKQGRTVETFVMDISQHLRIANPNPLVKQLEAGANPKTVVPDSAIIVRGGRAYTHQAGNIISAQMGSSAAEGAAGLPHGTIRVTTAGEIRAAGGTVELVPEPAYPGGPFNTWDEYDPNYLRRVLRCSEDDPISARWAMVLHALAL